MNYKLLNSKAKLPKADCAIVAVDNKGTLSSFGERIDQLLEGALNKVVAAGDAPQKNGQSMLLSFTESESFKRVLLLGKGKSEAFNEREFNNHFKAGIDAIKKLNIKKLVIGLADYESLDKTHAWKVQHMTQSIQSACYVFDQLKSESSPPIKLKSITLIHDDSTATQLNQSLEVGLAIATGVKETKDLGNLPGNICTPTYLAKEAKKLSKACPEIKTTILEEKQMKELGMGSFLSVSAGSSEPAKLVVMEYRGGKPKSPPHVLIGKGITFDTGGISLKPGAQMDEMKYDMCGAGSVMGVMHAIAELKPEINVIGILACAENMPDGTATKPGDIVTTMSGQTVEILNTDAEGRLVLCDALTYTEKFKPASVVDIATLTGACIIALGHHASGLLTSNESLADEILVAGEEAADKAWRLPLWDEYQSSLDSNFADMQNIGGRSAGTITAACFLSRFAKKYPWAHLDIAGVAWDSGVNKGATGRPVPLLMNYLLNKISD